MAKTDRVSNYSMVRTSISLPADDYAELEQIAAGNRVSVAWVIRDAVLQYLTVQAPLFHQTRTVSEERTQS